MIKLQDYEFTCDIDACYSKELKGITLKGKDIITMIDEIPIFALIASCAKGESKIIGAQELRYKESDRIKAIIYNLKKLNADIKLNSSGFIIKGPNKLHYTTIKTFNDHRIAMMCEIAKLITVGKLSKTNKLKSLISTSFPEFYKLLKRIYV